MKKIIFYFNPTVAKIFEKKEIEGEEKLVLSSPYNFVSRNEIIARVVNVDTDDEIKEKLDEGYTYYNAVNYFSIKRDEGVFYDEAANVYKASHYGFAACINGNLRVLSTLSVTKDKLKAYLTVFPTKFHKLPGIPEIDEIMILNHVTVSVGEAQITEQLEKINVESKSVGRILIAQGRKPIDGYQEYFTPLLEYNKKAGQVKSDGSIDFKEVGSVIQVSAGQELLKRIPGVKPSPGLDIFGKHSEPAILPVSGFKVGMNIEPSEFDSDIYISTIDGVLKVVNKKVSVLKTVIVKGNLDYKTGNIDFNGSVTIFGSVLPGFKIKATGDVYVQESLEDALIESGGDVRIGGGIVGKDMAKISCAGSLKAKYMLNATVEAGGNIVAEESIINSNVFSNKSISVSAKNGKIIGGATTALISISAKVIGAPSNPHTVINVGRNLYIEKEQDILTKEINMKKSDTNEVMRQIRFNFGETIFQNPKNFIADLAPAKKKQAVELLQDLSKKNAELKELSEKAEEIAQKLVLEQEPSIIAYDKMYPGSALSIKKNIMKIERVYSNVKFFEDKDNMQIRFTTAY